MNLGSTPSPPQQSSQEDSAFGAQLTSMFAPRPAVPNSVVIGGDVSSEGGCSPGGRAGPTGWRPTHEVPEQAAQVIPPGVPEYSSCIVSQLVGVGDHHHMMAQRRGLLRRPSFGAAPPLPQAASRHDAPQYVGWLADKSSMARRPSRHGWLRRSPGYGCCCVVRLGSGRGLEPFLGVRRGLRRGSRHECWARHISGRRRSHEQHCRGLDVLLG